MNVVAAGVMAESGPSSTTLAVIAIGISLLGLVSSVVLSGLALRRAKRGPEPRTRWELSHPTRRVTTASGPREEPGSYVLHNAGDADALNVRLDWLVGATSYDGPVTWERFGAGARFRLLPMDIRSGPVPVIRLRWNDARGKDQVWVSELPP